MLIAGGVAVGGVALIALHLLPTGLSPVRNAVSQYGISRYRSGYRVQTIGHAVAGAGAAVGVAALPGRGTVPIVLSRTGGRHGLLAAAAFGSVALAAAGVSRLLGRDGIDPAMGVLSGALAVVMLGTLLAMAMDRRAGAAHFGLIERGFYLAVTVWLVALCVTLAASVR